MITYLDATESYDPGESTRFGVAYRKEKTAWKIAPYPLRATPGSARKLIEWLKNTSAGKDCEMRVVSIALLRELDAAKP